MNSFQSFIMELIGLNPYFYRPSNIKGGWSAIRDMKDIEVKMIDDTFNSEREIEGSRLKEYVFKNSGRPIRHSEVIVHLIRSYNKG